MSAGPMPKLARSFSSPGAGQDKKLVQSKAGLKIVTKVASSASPFMLPEPNWVPDKEVKRCTKCDSKFEILTRRHHCRRCGLCFCSNCCDTRLPLPRMCFVDPVRQCMSCSEISRKETDFFERHLKTLLTGASFSVTSGDAVIDVPAYCSLQVDHTFLKIDVSRPECTIEPINLRDITGVQIHTVSSVDGNAVANGATIKYRFDDSFSVLRLIIDASVPDRRQSTLFLAALQRVLILLIKIPNFFSVVQSTIATPTLQWSCFFRETISNND